MKKLNWRNLRVSDSDGEREDDLGTLVERAPANLDKAIIENGMITEWQDFFISAPDEDPDWDTPRQPVDWTGFEDALAKSIGIEKEV